MTPHRRLAALLGSVLVGSWLPGAWSAGQGAASAGPLPVLVQAPGDEVAQLLGASRGGRWLTVNDALPLLKGQTGYVRRPLGGAPTSVRGGPPESFGEPCEGAYRVPLQPANVPARFQLFTARALNAAPRPVTSLPTANETYRQIVRAELVRRGLPNPTVRLVGLTRADLDGDGTQEVIIEAAQYAERGGGLFPPPVGRPGDYSIVLLRHVVRGQVLTVTLGADLAPPKPWDPNSAVPMPLATLIRLAGVADLNGDGRMELVLYSSYYEGSSFAVVEWTPARGLTNTPLAAGCGV